MRIRSDTAKYWNQVEEYFRVFREDLEQKFKGMRVRLLFRGQRSARWELQTTLERIEGANFSMREYDALLHKISPAVRTFTNREWELDNSGFVNVEDRIRPYYIPNYEFMAYARHHGFPTPLLDWTKSLYVALFFAFYNANEENNVAVFAYLDEFRVGIAGSAGSIRVASQNEYVSPHKRHFNQQSVYTTCTKLHKGEWVYSAHQEYFEQPTDRPLVAKLEIPGDQKQSFLSKLDQMNINPFTLFGSEEALMQMLWHREMVADSDWRNPIRLAPERE